MSLSVPPVLFAPTFKIYPSSRDFTFDSVAVGVLEVVLCVFSSKFYFQGQSIFSAFSPGVLSGFFSGVLEVILLSVIVLKFCSG